jgi:hypothetical protein
VIEENGRRKHVVPTPHSGKSGRYDDDDDGYCLAAERIQLSSIQDRSVLVNNIVYLLLSMIILTKVD